MNAVATSERRVAPLFSPAEEIVTVWMKVERGGKKFIASGEGEGLDAAIGAAKNEIAALMEG